MSGVVEYLNVHLLQIYHWVCEWKNVENRLTFGEVMGKSLLSGFLTHGVDITVLFLLKVACLYNLHVFGNKWKTSKCFAEWWGAGMVICLERGANLHMAQLIPLPLTVSCFSKTQIGFTFLVPAHPGSPGKGPLHGCVCVFCWTPVGRCSWVECERQTLQLVCDFVQRCRTPPTSTAASPSASKLNHWHGMVLKIWLIIHCFIPGCNISCIVIGHLHWCFSP